MNSEFMKLLHQCDEGICYEGYVIFIMFFHFRFSICWSRACEAGISVAVELHRRSSKDVAVSYVRGKKVTMEGNSEVAVEGSKGICLFLFFSFSSVSAAANDEPSS